MPHHGQRAFGNGGGIGQPALAGVATGQTAGLRSHDLHPSAFQGGQVLLDRRVLPHFGVHGRAEQHRGSGRQQRCHQEVVGQPGAIAGHEVSRRRRHHDEIGALPQTSVRDG